MRPSHTICANSMPRAGLVLPGMLSPRRGFNWPEMQVVTEIPRWQGFAVPVPVRTAIATMLLPARRGT